MPLPPETRVLGPRVLLKPVAPRERSAGGIVLPDVAKQSLNLGTVALVGDLGPDSSVRIERGQTVSYSPYAAVPLHINEEKYLLVHVDDLLLVL